MMHIIMGEHMTGIAKLFMHGRSQAVRLPKEFRLPGTEVRVSKIGHKIVLEPLGTSFGGDDLWARLDALGAADFLTDELPEDKPVEPDKTIDIC